jgi:hypothetical protein
LLSGSSEIPQREIGGCRFSPTGEALAATAVNVAAKQEKHMPISQVYQHPDGRWYGQHDGHISQPFDNSDAAWSWLDRQDDPWRSLGNAAAAVVEQVQSKYGIMVVERNSDGNRVELCRVSTNPEAIAKGARRKTRGGQRRYRSVEIVELDRGR